MTYSIRFIIDCTLGIFALTSKSVFLVYLKYLILTLTIQVDHRTENGISLFGELDRVVNADINDKAKWHPHHNFQFIFFP